MFVYVAEVLRWCQLITLYSVLFLLSCLICGSGNELQKHDDPSLAVLFLGGNKQKTFQITGKR